MKKSLFITLLALMAIALFVNSQENLEDDESEDEEEYDNQEDLDQAGIRPGQKFVQSIIWKQAEDEEGEDEAREAWQEDNEDFDENEDAEKDITKRQTCYLPRGGCCYNRQGHLLYCIGSGPVPSPGSK